MSERSEDMGSVAGGRVERRLVADAPLGLRRPESGGTGVSRRRESGRARAALDASLRMLAQPLARALRGKQPERREPRLRADRSQAAPGKLAPGT